MKPDHTPFISRRRFLLHTGAGAVVATAIAPYGRQRALAAGEAPAPGQSPGEGFTPLFNGRDLTGWAPVNVAPGTFTVRDRVIVSTGVPTGAMRTTRHYENFSLELEWRHMRPGGNAGLFVYADALSAPGVPFVRAIEVQILDGDSPEGIWTGHGDLFSIHGARMVPDRPHPRGWERCLPSERRAHPAGQWNHYRVESLEGRLTLAVNGKVVSGGSQCRPRRGYLCLESEGSECHFRNLWIKELPSSNPPPAEVAAVDEGFRSLYTGVDLAGWRSGPQHAGHWQAKDWTLECDGQGPAELRTRPEWRDVALICDWRLEGQDRTAGLLLRGDAKSELTLKPPSAGWHRTQVWLRGERLTLRLDDRPVLEDHRQTGLPPSGPLVLRHHGHPVQFASIYAKPLV